MISAILICCKFSKTQVIAHCVFIYEGYYVFLSAKTTQQWVSFVQQFRMWHCKGSPPFRTRHLRGSTKQRQKYEVKVKVLQPPCNPSPCSSTAAHLFHLSHTHGRRTGAWEKQDTLRARWHLRFRISSLSFKTCFRRPGNLEVRQGLSQITLLTFPSEQTTSILVMRFGSVRYGTYKA